MRMWRILAVTLALGLAASAAAQAPPTARLPVAQANPPPEPPQRYLVGPEAGEWLICVQTFREVQALRDEQQYYSADKAKMLAEQFVEYIKREHRMPAYIYERNRKERAAEAKRVANLSKDYWDKLDQWDRDGFNPVRRPLRYQTTKYPYEYAVLVGKANRNLKDIEAARDFLDDVRKLKMPPEIVCNTAVLGNRRDGATRDENIATVYINPFKLAMVVHNPTIELVKPVDDPEKADDLLKKLNEGEKYSVLRCSKPWTLMVKIYQGPATLQTPQGPSMFSWLGFG